MSVKAFGFVDVPGREGEGQVPDPSFFIEIDAEYLAVSEGDLVEGKDEFAGGFRGHGSKAIDLFGELGFLVLKAALGAALALHGEAGLRHLVAYGRAVPEGNQQKQNVILVEYVFTEDFDAIVLGADMVEFLFPR